jgi:poly [ADP-ribose] polymerase 2/3/4
LYNKKYREKTNKGYTEVKMALGNPKAGIDVKMKEKKNSKKEESKNGGPKSKLDNSLQSLVSFIFDMNLME